MKGLDHICIVGGAGFIGSQVTSLLCAADRQVTVLGRSPEPRRPLPPQARYVRGDYSDSDLLRRVFHDVDAVIDLGYSTSPQSSFIDPLLDLGNVGPTVTLLQAAVECRLSRVLFVSSGGTVYGVSSADRIAEDHPTNPLSPYGITKLAIEKYLLMFHAIHGLDALIARPGNAFGEGQVPFTGQGFIATAISLILRREPVVVYGEHGTVRDYLHVSDVAAGIIAALNAGEAGHAYNIGSGIGRTNRQVLDALSALATPCGFRLELKTAPPRPFDVPANVLDCSRLAAVSGWAPRLSFENALARTWNHFHRP